MGGAGDFISQLQPPSQTLRILNPDACVPKRALRCRHDVGSCHAAFIVVADATLMTHYGNPRDGCLPDERTLAKDVRLIARLVDGDACFPPCAGDDETCPEDKPE